MINVAISGGNGFVGSHMRFFLNEKKDEYEVVLIEKEDFEDDNNLTGKLNNVNVVLHFAGLNRGDEEEIYNVNTGLTKKILSSCGTFKIKPKIIFISSTHNTRDTAYGRSKRDSEKMILDWGKTHSVPTTSVVSTNIYGEFCKPNYNSFVATFCNDLVEKRESQVNESASVNLIYVREVCQFFFGLLNKDILEEKYSLVGKEVKIGEVYSLLKNFRDEYFSGVIPKINSDFELSMFNTLRSYLYPNHFPVKIDLKTDNRGSFVEVVKERVGGQSSFSTTHPGITRGNHYHTRKIERFCVLSGEASIRLRKLFSNEVIEYKVSGKNPIYIDMPVYYTHSIENIGSDELLTMFWINEIFDPNDPDTFMEAVIV